MLRRTGCHARRTILARLPPLSLDAPGTEALVVGVIAREVAMLDQPSTHVAAVVVDRLVLAHGGWRD